MEETFPSGAEAEPFSLFVMLLAALLVIIPFWFIFSKAGYSKWLSILMVIPILNLALLYFLAFSQWPILREKTSVGYPPKSSAEENKNHLDTHSSNQSS